MKSREQIAIEALTNIANGIPNPVKYATGTLAALTPPAQGSIDADGMPPLPPCKLLSGPSLASLHVLYSADQMRAYALADRAARQSAAPGCPICGCVGLHACMGAKMEPWTPEKIAELDAVLAKYEPAAPAPSKQTPMGRFQWEQANPRAEPVPQGVAMRECGNCHGSGWMVRDADIGTDQECFSCDGKGEVEDDTPAAPTATSGGEAAWDYDLMGLPNEEVAEMWRASGHSGVVPFSFASRIEKKMRSLSPPPLPAATDAASVPSCPEIQKAFITLESNGEARTIVLKFNQSADAYAVHDFLLKGASAIGLMYPGDAAGVRASTLEEAATELEAMQKSAADDIAYWGNSMDGNDLAAQSALTCGASAIRALISKETGNAN